MRQWIGHATFVVVLAVIAAGYNDAAANPPEPTDDGISQSEEAERTDEGSRTSEDEVDGRQLFANNCAGCHGRAGKGTGAGPNLGSRLAGQSDAADRRTRIRHQIISGSKRMPAFSNFKDGELRALVDYVETLVDTDDSAPSEGATSESASTSESRSHRARGKGHGGSKGCNHRKGRWRERMRRRQNANKSRGCRCQMRRR
jgi:mono/diheme cytochrome c family protein